MSKKKVIRISRNYVHGTDVEEYFWLYQWIGDLPVYELHKLKSFVFSSFIQPQQ